MSTTETVLAVDAIRKVYGGEVALADASFSVGAGEIHGLLGANGAGKSTLVRIISGVEQQDGGTVAIGGHVLPVPHTAQMARELGLAYIHQDRALVSDLSIAENVALTIGYPTRRGFIDWRAVDTRARDALERVGVRHDLRTPVGEIPIADQTLVAISRALALDARVILLDEPTANLGDKDSALLYERLAGLAAQGVACVLITHALGEALRVCHRITVLRDGKVTATRPSSELTGEELTQLVVGRTVAAALRSHAGQGVGAGEVVLTLEDARCERLGPLSLELRRGQVLGITGLADSGHLLVGDLLTGQRGLDGGDMQIGGEAYRPRGPADARTRKVACVPPDRLRDGVATQMSARENLFLDGRGVGTRYGIPRGRERAEATTLLERGKVKPPQSEAMLSTLSGGNMQKVLMAKWLAADPDLLVLCEPTVGVDVGAREDIYARLHEAAARGAAILLASSDFEEVAALSDEVVVIRYGSVVSRLAAADATIERLTALSGGGLNEVTAR